MLRHNRKEYTVSPYALLWNDGRYYAPSYDPEKKKIVPYRVDRMRGTRVLDERAERNLPFDPVAFSKKVLWMYEGDAKEQEVILVAENQHMIILIDRFGDGIKASEIKEDKDHFRAVVHVIPSSTFYSWIFQFRGEIRITGPGDVKKEYEALLRQVLKRQK